MLRICNRDATLVLPASKISAPKPLLSPWKLLHYIRVRVPRTASDIDLQACSPVERSPSMPSQALRTRKLELVFSMPRVFRRRCRSGIATPLCALKAIVVFLPGYERDDVSGMEPSTKQKYITGHLEPPVLFLLKPKQLAACSLSILKLFTHLLRQFYRPLVWCPRRIDMNRKPFSIGQRVEV